MYDVINNLYHLIVSLQMETENVSDRSNNISVSIGLQNVMDRYGTDQKAIRYNGNIASYALASFSDYEAFSPIHLCSTWQSHAQGLIIAKLSLQRSVWLILIKKWKVERTNTSYDGFFFFFLKFHEHLCLLFYPKISVLVGGCARTKIYLQLFPIVWDGIVWVDAF